MGPKKSTTKAKTANMMMAATVITLTERNRTKKSTVTKITAIKRANTPRWTMNGTTRWKKSPKTRPNTSLAST